MNQLLLTSEFGDEGKDIIKEYKNTMEMKETNVNLWFNGLENMNKNEMIENKSNLFVLLPKEDYSAVELLVMVFKKVKNVITVGKNSMYSMKI